MLAREAEHIVDDKTDRKNIRRRRMVTVKELIVEYPVVLTELARKIEYCKAEESRIIMCRILVINTLNVK